MASRAKRLPTNVDGEFFVDETCIDCDTCRQLAPGVFSEGGDDRSRVHAQPADAESRRRALHALVACPTVSIGGGSPDEVRHATEEFPLAVDAGVSYCGFTSADSFGASSWLVERPNGNWLVDSPRFAAPIVRAIEARGGISGIFLTHRDDVADAGRFAKRFGAKRVIHRRDLDAEPDAEIVLEGEEPTPLAEDLLAIPTPGHTAGHAVLLHADRHLFTGDHVWWSRRQRRLIASRSACWWNWKEQTRSVEKLPGFRFEWILPGHGERFTAPPDEMRRQLEALAAWMRGVA